MGSVKKNKSHDPAKFDHYKDPVAAMLQIATFAGAITFTVVLAPRNDRSHAITELAYANSLFFGCIMGCVLVQSTIALYKISIEQDEKWKAWKKGSQTEEQLKELDTGPEARGEVSWEEVREKLENVEVFRKTRLPWLDQLVKDDTLVRFKISDHGWLIPTEFGFVSITLFVAFYLMLHASGQFLQYNGPFIVGSIIYLGLGVPAFVLWFYCLWVDNTLELVTKLVSLSDTLDKSKEKAEGKNGKMEDKINRSSISINPVNQV
jgi:hypothetical protein